MMIMLGRLDMFVCSVGLRKTQAQNQNPAIGKDETGAKPPAVCLPARVQQYPFDATS